MKRFIFRIELQGFGRDVQEAWNDAVEHFELDPGPPPEEYEESNS